MKKFKTYYTKKDETPFLKGWENQTGSIELSFFPAVGTTIMFPYDPLTLEKTLPSVFIVRSIVGIANADVPPVLHLERTD